ncbi:MAG: hypothetical protein ACR2NN_24580 [Bryobacteraceae bacterium]
MLAAKLGIARALGIPVEIICLHANLLSRFRIGRIQGAKHAHQFFNFARVEEALLVDLYPMFLIRLVIRVLQRASQFPKVLASMIQIDNLNRAWKMLLGTIPDLLGSVAMTTFFSARLQPRFQASRYGTYASV